MRRTLVVVAGLVLLAGCGGSSSGKPATGGGATSGGGDQIAACDDLVGQPAKRLVDDGCTSGGAIQGTLTYSCSGTDFYAASDGNGHNWWAKKGGTIQSGTDAQYDAAHTACINGT